MDKIKLLKLQKLIESGQAEKFYHWKAWRRLRKEVLKLDNYECQICKRKGRYKRGEIVHHIKHVIDRPDLALSIYDGKERQLITVCTQCHRDEHPEARPKVVKIKEKFNNEERWD